MTSRSQELNEVQTAILRAVIDAEKEYPSIAITEHHVFEKIGLGLQEIRANLRFMERMGCVKLENLNSSESEAVWVKITPEGYMALQGQNEFLIDTKNSGVNIENLMQVGTAHNSQLQQGTQGSVQNLSIDSTSKVALDALLKDIKELASNLNLDAQVQEELQSDIQTIEVQASSSKPKKTILKVALESVASIIKGSVEKAISSELALHAPTVLQQIQEYIQHLGHS